MDGRVSVARCGAIKPMGSGNPELGSGVERLVFPRRVSAGEHGPISECPGRTRKLRAPVPNHSNMGDRVRGLQGVRVDIRRAPEVTVRTMHYRAGQVMTLHEHDFAGVTFVVGGRLSDVFAGGSAVCQALTMVMKPAGSPHETRVGDDGATTIHLEISSDVARRVGFCGTTQALYVRAGRVMGRVLMQMVHGRSEDLARAIEEVLLHGVRVCPRAPAATSFAFAEREIRGTSTASAGRASMHPVSFARRFRRATGEAPSSWRSHQRMARAAGAIARGRGTLASIAHASGFSDQAHLCREFKRCTGLTPGEYRDLVVALGACGRQA